MSAANKSGKHGSRMSLDTSKLAAIGQQAGLCAVGFCRAEPFTKTAQVLRDRKQAGLHAGMQFTYRNPERSTEPERLVPGATALVVGALEFSAEPCERPDDGNPYARVAAYARADYYTPLRVALEAIAGALRDEGHRAVVSADENGLVDRATAHRAALGWWGKNSNILLPDFGSLVVLGAVVTDAPIVSADPETGIEDGCGSCRQCLDGCPTGAIVAPGTVDARRCLAWLVQADGVFDPEYRVALGDRIYGCDDCSEVCPPNRVRVRHRPRAARPQDQQTQDQQTQDQQTQDQQTQDQQTWVPVLDLLDASDSELMAALGRWYIPKRQPRYLRRNALVVLANVGEPSEPRVRAAVDRALRDSDPLIRAHAVWCARRLGLSLEALTEHDDPLVRAELERPVPARGVAA